MAEQISDQVFAYDAPTGWKLETPDPRESVFTLGGGLTLADDHLLKIARRHFIEVDVENFDREGKNWVDRATGKHYNLVLFDPTMSEHPPDTGVELFFISDGLLVYLRPRDGVGRTKTVSVDEVVAT